jgi:hypothetical protein
MLHDPSHYTPIPIAEEIRLSAEDRSILRGLASELAGIAALPVHEETARLWRKPNPAIFAGDDWDPARAAGIAGLPR